GYPDMPAIGRRRGAGEAVQAMLLFQASAQDFALPEDLAVAPVEAEQQALLLSFQTGGEKDAVAPHDRRGVPLAGDGDFPGDVLGLAPLDGKVRLGGGPIPAWTAPPGPLLRHDKTSEGQPKDAQESPSL